LFVLILQIPLSSSVGPNISLSVFLSNTDSRCIMLSLTTHQVTNRVLYIVGPFVFVS
jgi:hypothetical protein